MANRFILNETSYFGSGARKELKNEIARRGFRKAFIVADKDLIQFGTTDMVLGHARRIDAHRLCDLAILFDGCRHVVFHDDRQQQRIRHAVRNIEPRAERVRHRMHATQTAQAAVDAVKQLSRDLKIPQTLREIKIPQDALEQLAKDAFADVCTGGNPREIGEKDILALYRKAY